MGRNSSSTYEPKPTNQPGGLERLIRLLAQQAAQELFDQVGTHTSHPCETEMASSTSAATTLQSSSDCCRDAQPKADPDKGSGEGSAMARSHEDE
jgi:hypothetical protein